MAVVNDNCIGIALLSLALPINCRERERDSLLPDIYRTCNLAHGFNGCALAEIIATLELTDTEKEDTVGGKQKAHAELLEESYFVSVHFVGV